MIISHFLRGQCITSMGANWDSHCSFLCFSISVFSLRTLNLINKPPFFGLLMFVKRVTGWWGDTSEEWGKHWGKWAAEIPEPNKAARVWLGTFDRAEAAVLSTTTRPSDSKVPRPSSGPQIQRHQGKLNFPGQLQGNTNTSIIRNVCTRSNLRSFSQQNVNAISFKHTWTWSNTRSFSPAVMRTYQSLIPLSQRDETARSFSYDFQRVEEYKLGDRSKWRGKRFGMCLSNFLFGNILVCLYWNESRIQACSSTFDLGVNCLCFLRKRARRIYHWNMVLQESKFACGVLCFPLSLIGCGLRLLALFKILGEHYDTHQKTSLPSSISPSFKPHSASIALSTCRRFWSPFHWESSRKYSVI